MTHDTVITGARVVAASGTTMCDIGITQGQIATLGSALTGTEVIDATGLIALPGGIDSHVHISQPSGPGIEMADDFISGTRAAACGGNTTILPFCLPEDGQTLREAVAAYRKKAEGNCMTDVAFHLIVKQTDPVTLGQDLPALIRAGYTSFKVFMTYAGLALSDRQILDVMAVAKEQNAMVMVHAENEDAIEFLRDRAEREGETGPYHHATTRPIPVEREATHRAISLAEIAGVPLTIVHVSNGEATEEIVRARARGLTVFAETCPQYITLTASDLDRDGFDGAKYVCSPPPRTADEWPKIWAGIEQGTFDLFSSDHCPFRFNDTAGKDAPGARTSFRNIPNGIPGVETRLPILFSEGVVAGRLSLERFAAITATNHARLYGLYPRKGAIMVGADADITLWDPTVTKPIRQHDLHHGSDYTPWEGFEVTGWPVRTILRGKSVMQDGHPVGPPMGEHLERGAPDVQL
ncbi:dihydropyrimidinase [Roseobacter denitrificans]|uniref:D-hydantoinase n=1 Tax=Roseobacter denitrificans (strain ATCC 33942 / OCh 114) TaxID=375451 RepID=Q166W9_ROSDO|nr:dihydropyrimidinase [Roseobacter denitrificans]ABG31974.1 D-hydantoinase [Roseobacter denitrificans OCh 114]AVL51509.1 dihydropyrimidinase [Roseobacter denitrificans]SFG35572.1 dihydropyrimidinase [Roseobacter denitrificans OCh 114]